MVNAIPLDDKSVGQKIRLCRVERGWTQAMLAAITKVPQVVISNLERDRRVDEKYKENVLKALGLLN